MMGGFSQLQGFKTESAPISCTTVDVQFFFSSDGGQP